MMLAILVPVCAAVAVIVWNYYRLQRASCRRRRDDGLPQTNQKSSREHDQNSTKINKLRDRVATVEQLMRDVG
jgi:hypothetical protein